MDTATAAAIFAGVGLLWTAVWSVISANKLNKIQNDITLSNRLHDQSIQRLYRARDAVLTIDKAYNYFDMAPDVSKISIDTFLAKVAEMTSSIAELKGIAHAIDDKILLDLLNTSNVWQLGQNRDSAKTGTVVVQLHERITRLLEEASTI